MTAVASYADFLERKRRKVAPIGFEVSEHEIPAVLFPYQCSVVRWAVQQGRAAIFAGTGLGKTAMQLSWAQLVSRFGNVLILAPLAVAAQTVAEGAKFGIPVTHCREASDVRPGINITNYERMERFLPSEFVGIVLDESSILKGQDGKTRTALIETWRNHRFRLACTATPAPNDYMEFGNHAEFLGMMKTSEMLATFFVHDAAKTQDWRLKGHAERHFWAWVASWAVMFRRPSDLGFDDSAYALPPLNMHQHVVESTDVPEGMLFAVEASDLMSRRRARASSIDERVKKCAEIVAREPNEQWLIWCDLNSEGDALEAMIPDAVQVAGRHDPEIKEQRMTAFANGELRVMVSKASICGFGMNFQSCARVMFVGLSDSWEQYYQAIRRCWRFGQMRPVACHVVIASAEGAVLRNIERKELQAEHMAQAMVREVQLAHGIKIGDERSQFTFTKVMEVPAWLIPAC